MNRNNYGYTLTINVLFFCTVDFIHFSYIIDYMHIVLDIEKILGRHITNTLYRIKKRKEEINFFLKDHSNNLKTLP